ncbi:MAG TPA: HlyD family efflux transporter periplasmic adaptor subunit [Solirubrobacteraceae bacterium]|jgi:multidrug efflux pump subunit AcrA (membrane-fusion protein)
MTQRTSVSWLVYVLGALCAGAIVAAFLVVGPASGSQTAVTRTAKAAQGVVQSTVSGSGNLAAANQLNLGFKTGGTVTHIYATQGQHVTEGQLLATLDPQTAEVTLEQSRASLQSAIANLAQEEESDGETSTGGTSGGTGSNASAASFSSDSHTTTSTHKTTSGKHEKATEKTTPEATEAKGASSGASSTTSKPTESAATREANIASARANVSSDRLTVQSDEQAVQDTKLYAPEDGTIVSLTGQVGEVVSPSGTTKASSSSSSSGSGSSTGAAATGGVSALGGATGSSSASKSSSSSSSSSSSAFAVLSDLSSMQLVVPLSESEIGNVKAGQPATVTVEALSGAKLAAHVSEVALLSTSSSGAVSYDVTFQLDQMDAGLKVGMSATAEVVVKQAEGVNVPTSAISADSVTVERDGKQVRQRVTTGLAGNTSTIVLSGLQAGETVVLPAASTTSSSTSLTSRLAGRTGGGLGGGGGLAGGGGGPAFFRGGG